MDSKAALGFANPNNNPVAEHTTTNIGSGVTLDLSPWEGIFCRGLGNSWTPVGQINVTTTVAFGSKSSLGFATPNNTIMKHRTINVGVGAGVMLYVSPCEWIFYKKQATPPHPLD